MGPLIPARADACPSLFTLAPGAVTRPEVGRAWLPLVGILLLGAGLRVHHLDGASVWGDEACMLALAALPSGEIVRVLAAPDRPDVDVAPPLYFLLLRAFTRPIGVSAWSARLFSAACGVVAIAALYGLAFVLFGRRSAAFAALLMATSAFQVWYSQEARMYSLVTLLGIVSTLALVRSLVHGRGWPLYVVLAAAAMYTQYYAYLLVACQIGLAALFLAARARGGSKRPPGTVRGLALAAGALTILVLPWLRVVARDLSQASALDRGFPSHFSPLLSGPFVLSKFALFGNESFVLDYWPLYVLLMPLFGWFLLRGTLALNFRYPAASWLLLGLLFLPFAMVFAAASLGAPVYKSHPFILFSPYFYALVAFGLTRARGMRGTLVLLSFVAANGFVMMRLNYGDVYTKPKVRQALAYVARHMRPDDLLLKLPAKLHTAPVETGEILSWRIEAPQGLRIVELNGRDLSDLISKLDSLTSTQSRFFLAVAETQFSEELVPPLIARCRERFQLTERKLFPSRIRDFGLAVYSFETAGAGPGGGAGKE